MSDYDASDVNWLRPPDVEGESGGWRSIWIIGVGDSATGMDPATIQTRVAQLRRALATVSIRLMWERERTYRLEVESPLHPLSPDAFPVVDDLLFGLDYALGGIDEINGSPRDQWRTFRSNRGT